MTDLAIRSLRAGDEPALMDVCLRTGHAGGDATGLLDDGELMGALWCRPYLVLEPDLVSVVASERSGPVGYVLGALDSAAFHAAAEARYWPGARERFPLGAAPEGSLDQLLVSLIHDRSHAAGSGNSDSGGQSDLQRLYPSHLHIDLLPEAQGVGFGRQLIDRLIGQLRERGSGGVRLGVSQANERAIAFYRHLGFTEWEGPDDGINLTFVRAIAR